MPEESPGLFIAQVDDEPWVAAEPLGLPPGVKWRLYETSDGGDRVMLVRFPPGYVEPRHVHEAEHWDVIVEGEMHVDGRILRRGDYLRGFPGKRHGPMSYPKGCTVFAVVRGGSILHEYEDRSVGADSGADA